MAIYHLSGAIISRSQGRSVIAAAAYRSASKLHDEWQGVTHDYTKKQDVVFTDILLPEGAPTWMGERERLWNRVEAAEKRKDAQLAREFNLSLPNELSIEQNTILVKEFVQQQFVNQGMVADIAIHNDVTSSGERQPHAHVMLTLREVNPDGFGPKVRAWNAKDNLLQWREAWAATVNRHLFLHGHDVTIDHRTLVAQGIALEPQHKIGPVGAQQQLVRRARLADHQRIARENGEKLLKEPGIVLTAITRQQSTFTHQDLARFVNRHTVDAEQFQVVYNTIKSNKAIVALGTDAHGRERFTTQEMLQLEQTLVAHADQLAQRKRHGVRQATQDFALTTRPLTDEQALAFNHLVREGDLKAVIGYAGTGKSYLLGAANMAWEAEGHRVLGTALSGIAAENLESGSGIPSRTLASYGYYWDKGEQRLTENDILVVDEAGMIGSRQLGRLLDEVVRARAKVVLVGDPYQLQAIEAGAAFRAVTERVPTVRLTDIRRQQHAWQRNATVELATGQTDAALQRYAQHDHVHAFETQALAKQGLITLWNDVRLNQPDKTQLILAYTRDDVGEFNTLARTLRQQHHELGDDYLMMTARGERLFAEGDRVYFLKNDRPLGVKNGTLGTIETIQGQTLTVRLDASLTQAVKPGEKQRGQKEQREQRKEHREQREVDKDTRLVTFNSHDYAHIDHGYAATIHKSQGVTVDRAYLLASKYLDSHATYVALSRHRDSADVFYGKEAFAHEQALAHTLGRERAKDVTLDYYHPASAATDFAEQRGFEQTPQKTHSRHLENERHTCPDEPGFLAQTTPPLSDERHIAPPKAQHYEALLHQSLREAQQTQSSHNNSTTSFMADKDISDWGDFREFTREFEANHPEQAKALQAAMQPEHEKRALDAEKKIALLEEARKGSHTPTIDQVNLERYAAGIAKQSDVMAYLQQKDATLSDRIRALSHQYEKTRDRGMDRGR